MNTEAQRKAREAQIARDIINDQVKDPGSLYAHWKRAKAAIFVDQGADGQEAAHLAMTVPNAI